MSSKTQIKILTCGLKSLRLNLPHQNKHERGKDVVPVEPNCPLKCFNWKSDMDDTVHKKLGVDNSLNSGRTKLFRDLQRTKRIWDLWCQITSFYVFQVCLKICAFFNSLNDTGYSIYTPIQQSDSASITNILDWPRGITAHRCCLLYKYSEHHVCKEKGKRCLCTVCFYVSFYRNETWEVQIKIL